ncbi:DUF1353 domain-containing protein [Pontibacterium sp.]|uniref:DUF1353 domain-containing protein n=1 Tax=Pontibacterium sp. TaxID=2036026 RepID=UPI0035618FBE
MPFQSELVISPKNGKEWVLREQLVYRSHEQCRVVNAHKGFICDLASIPRIFRPVFPVHGKHTRAAVIHDWLYRNKLGKRKEADLIFLEAMEELGVSRFKRYTMYAAVRAGGWTYWS